MRKRSWNTGLSRCKNFGAQRFVFENMGNGLRLRKETEIVSRALPCAPGSLRTCGTQGWRHGLPETGGAWAGLRPCGPRADTSMRGRVTGGNAHEGYASMLQRPRYGVGYHRQGLQAIASRRMHARRWMPAARRRSGGAQTMSASMPSRGIAGYRQIATSHHCCLGGGSGVARASWQRGALGSLVCLRCRAREPEKRKMGGIVVGMLDSRARKRCRTAFRINLLLAESASLSISWYSVERAEALKCRLSANIRAKSTAPCARVGKIVF